MSDNSRQLLTIITEARLESLLLKDIDRLGAKGYTVTDARGKGSRGVRGGDWQPSQNIRLEIICTEPVAAVISGHMQERYYDNYAMVLFQSEVFVLRPEKFGKEGTENHGR